MHTEIGAEEKARENSLNFLDDRHSRRPESLAEVGNARQHEALQLGPDQTDDLQQHLLGNVLVSVEVQRDDVLVAALLDHRVEDEIVEAVLLAGGEVAKVRATADDVDEAVGREVRRADVQFLQICRLPIDGDNVFRLQTLRSEKSMNQ